MSKNTVIEDIAKLASNAAAVAFENAKDALDSIKGKAKGAASNLDLVTREEFDIQRELVQKLVKANEELTKKLAELEGKIK